MTLINPNNAISLLELVARTAQAERINSIENSVGGGAFGQRNFEGKWEGYELNNQPTVSYKGTKYNVRSAAYASKRKKDKINIRSGEKFLGAAWR